MSQPRYEERYDHRRGEPPPREIPGNIEAEQALLGAILINNRAYNAVSGFLRPEHFLEPLHRKIFENSSLLIAGGRVATTITAKQDLPADGKVGDLTIAQYVSRLASEAVNIINAEDYGRAIYDLALRRSLIEIGTDMVNQAFDAPLDSSPKAQIEEAQRALFGISELSAEAEGKGRFAGPALVDGYLDMISREGEAVRDGRAGVPIVIPEIGTVLSENRLMPKRLYGMLSSSGEGKTSLTLQIIYGAIAKEHPVLFLSYDQEGPVIVAQMVAQQVGIPVRRQQLGDLTDKDVDKGTSIAQNLASLPFEVIDCDSTKDTAGRLAAYTREFLRRKANGKTPLVVIDHIGTIRPDASDMRSDEGSKARNIAQQLKSLAKEMNAAVLVLQQRSGAGMRRINPRPTKEDLYGGEAARQPFDAIFYLYRADIHMQKQLDTAADEKEQDKIRLRFFKQFGDPIEDMAEIGAIKVRFGNPFQRRKVRFVAEFTRYETVYRPGDDDQGSLV